MLNKLFLTLRSKAVKMDREIGSTVDFGHLMDGAREHKGVLYAIWIAIDYLYLL
jgi:hypothetical protein